MFIRHFKSRNGNIQVQVVQKANGNNKVVKHLGTARNNLEVQELTDFGKRFIDETRIKSGKISFFDNRYSQSDIADFMSRLIARGAFDSTTFHFFNYFYKTLGFNNLKDDLFCRLVIARIVYPASKERTRDWLERKFGYRYSLTAIYRGMEKVYSLKYQEKLESSMWSFITQNLSSDISVLFFDVTTLYYEAFDEDDFRKYGYSKDRKDGQPQLIVALTVTGQGIPIHVRLFPGNKFEGHTIIPCIQDIVKSRDLKDSVVVADSAMVSAKNMDDLEMAGIKFIVGGRLSNLAKNLFDRVVSQTAKVDGSASRFDIGRGHVLIVSYSSKRANKDRTDRNKQLARASFALTNPSSIVRRYKFLKRAEGVRWELNQTNLDKAISLEGLKGYVTNAPQYTNEEIINKYASLWQVEKSFRISKSDLKARPIFHTVREKIEAHVTIVFAALAISRYVELTTGKSLQKVLDLLDSVKEVVFEEPASGKSFSKYTQADDPEVQDLLKHANIDWVT